MVLKFPLSCSRVYRDQTSFYFVGFFLIFESFMRVSMCCQKSINCIEARIIYMNDQIIKRQFFNNRSSINYYYIVIIV